MIHHLTRLTALAALTLVLAACSSTDAGDEGAAPEGCGDCAAEIADLEEQLAALPDVARVGLVERVHETPTNGAGVFISLYSTEESDTGLADQAARLVWDGTITPADDVEVLVGLADGEVLPRASYSFREGADHAFYAGQWGPRPVD